MKNICLLALLLTFDATLAHAGNTSHNPACHGMSHFAGESAGKSSDGMTDLRLQVFRGIDGCYSITRNLLTLKGRAVSRDGSPLPIADAKVTSLDAGGNVLYVNTIPSFLHTWDRQFLDAAKLVVEMEGFPPQVVTVEQLQP